MSKGGSKVPSKTEQTVTDIPDFLEPYYHDLMARTGYETAQPYTAYPGQRLQYFTPMEQEAMQRMGLMGVSGSPAEFDQMSSILRSVGGAGGTYTPGFDPGSLADREAIQKYMDPYMQEVVDREKEEAMRTSQMLGTDIGLKSAGAGSLGGYREAIMQAERQRNVEDQMGDIQSKGLQSAFRQALSSFEADRQARAMLEQMKQAAGAQRLQARGYQLQAAGMLGGLAQQRQQMELERLQQMLMAGQMERGLLQQGLDIGYQDFLRQQGYPMEMLTQFSNVLQGMNIPAGTTRSIYGEQPSGMQQTIGTLGGIAGLVHGFRGFGGGAQ